MIESKKYVGFKVVFEDNLIKVKKDMPDWEDWREEKDLALDDVTYALDKATWNLFKESVRQDASDCLIAYSCNEETAEKIIGELPEPVKLDLNFMLTARSIEEIEPNPPENLTKDVNLDTINEKSINIKELFEIKLNLPYYQRPYRWGRKNIEFFWDDIRNLREKEVPYDFGIIVLHRKNKNNFEYDIVDGQQRIVTLSLILRALSCSSADSFINNITLQGKDSEKNIGYNLQWFRRQVDKLDDNDKKGLQSYILNSYVDIVVMENLDDALKFFDRMNTTGVPLTNTDILKSHHLLALSDCTELSDDAKERWKEEGFVSENIHEFKKYIVNKWESLDPWLLNKRLSLICALRMIKEGKYPYGTDEIEDIELFRKGKNVDGKYSGLDSPIADGEFFFWYVFNVYKKFDAIYSSEDAKHALELKNLLLRPRAQEMFDLLILYIQEKFPQEKGKDIYNKLVDLVFSWLVYYCLYNDSVRFETIRNSAMDADSLFNAIVSSKNIEDCFDCYCENPLEHLEREGWGDRADGNGVYYLIRRELRRIYG